MENQVNFVGKFSGIRNAVVTANQSLASGKSVRIFADTRTLEVWAEACDDTGDFSAYIGHHIYSIVDYMGVYKRRITAVDIQEALYAMNDHWAVALDFYAAT